MKKVTLLLLTLLIAFAFISCANEPMTPSEDVSMVSFTTGDNSRSLSQSFTDTGNMVWKYTAVKADNTGLETGKQETPKLIEPDGKLTNAVGPFSHGDWTFTLYGAETKELAESGKFAYIGSTTATIKDSNSTVNVKVTPQISATGKGTLVINENIDLKDSSEHSIKEGTYKTLIEVKKIGEIDALATPSLAAGVYTYSDIASGSYLIKVKYVSLADDEVIYGEDTISATVFDNLTTTIGGSLNQLTSETKFSPDVDGSVIASTKATLSATESTVAIASSPADPYGKDNLATSITFPEGTFPEETSVALEVKPYNASDLGGKFVIDGVSAFAAIDITPTNATTGNPISFTGKATVTTFIAKNLNYEDITINYNGTGEAPTKVSYDPVSGKFVFETSHFSEFYVAVKNVEAINMTTNIAYKTIVDAVEAITNDGTPNSIVILSDITQSGFVVKNGQNIVLDLNSYLYTINATVGSTGTSTNGIQILKGSKVSIKNGKINQVRRAMVFQNYGDLTIEDVTVTCVDGVQYVCSNNNGSLTLKGETNIVAPLGQCAFDLYYWPNNGYPDGVIVTVDEDFTGKIDGRIEYGSDGSRDDYAEKVKLYIKAGTFENFRIVTTLPNPSILISGGTFSECPNVDYLEDGYYPKRAENGFVVEKFDGTVIRSEEDFEKIGLNPIPQTSSQFIDNAANDLNGNYILLKDITVEHLLYIGENATVKFDLNGFMIESKFPGFSIANYGSLNILDSSKTEENKFGVGGIYNSSKSTGGIDPYYSHDAIRNFGNLVIYGGSFGDNNLNRNDINNDYTYGAALRNQAGGKVTIEGGYFTCLDGNYNKFDNNVTTFSYAIRNYGDLTINDCYVYGRMNGGIAGDGGNTVINNGEINVYGEKSFYCLATTKPATITVNGGKFIKENGTNGGLLGGFSGMPSWNASDALEENGYTINGGTFTLNGETVDFI